MRTLLDSDGFRAALVVGGVGVLALWALRWKRTPFTRLPLGGRWIGASVVTVIAMLAGLRAHDALSVRLVFAVALLFAGGAVVSAWWFPVRMFMLTPGALLLASVLTGVDTWVRTLIFVVTVVGAPLAVTVDRKAARLLPLLFFMTAIGIYVCVPDTEIAAAMVGATLFPTLLGLDPSSRAATGATAAATGLLVYTAALGGYGRPGAVVGGMACLGVLALAPLSRWVRAPQTLRNVAVVTVVHAGLVLFVARVAGLRESAWSAAGLAAPAFVIAWLLLAVAIRRRRPPAAA